ncbi:thioredoxin [Synechococcus sp. CS-1325]|uniref:thioredoxin domain-containing protein n=1 Tax=unclassified Synechococcus TaxID=2626047 RepID=UPI000DB6D767|nr:MULTISPECIES: thioredoxin domain-containing protein [unclassified Synechococcus]MCT0200002.1 thioredoxin [Synechococcus sp. CS-1325]MCT0212000.1 thioredoxin [Synechococcus sp. CS-1326]MCT0232410.1 thioredoxin [Synechococcus sp. CS-1327]PZU97165.1 MAG: thioredoxin [Cyanobium sp.]
MTEPNSKDPAPSPLGRRERILLAAIAAALGLLLFQLRGGLQPQAPLEQMARRSLELPVALANGRPTILEFYADWCAVCRSMAPAVEAIETKHRGALDVVLLNVDNPRWAAEIERYDVNGIPQLEFFDREGQSVGRSLGGRSLAELDAIATALIAGKPLPRLAGVGSLSQLDVASTPVAGPRSHG